jgi:sulfide:quinone oxidoreductase
MSQHQSPHSLPDPLRVVIAGGGVAALEALVALRGLAPSRLTVTVITDARHFYYRPLLIGEPFGLGHPRRYALEAICADLGAELVRDRVQEVLPDQHLVRTGAGLVAYDVLLTCLGAQPFPAFQDGVTFEREVSPEDFDEALADFSDGMAPRVAIVVPDGVAWTMPAYELALLTAAWGEHHHPDSSCVTLLTPEPAPLAAFGRAASAGVAHVLDAARVVVRCGVHPDVVTATSLRAGGAWMGADRIVSLPLLAGPRLAGLPADAHGFIEADEHGRVRDVDDVYVAGDASTFPITQGGLAAQQADLVVADVVRRAGGDPPELEDLVLRGLLRTADGPRYLRAELADVDATSRFSSEPLWWPPSKIAARWLAPYLARVDVEQTSAGGMLRGR